MSSETLLPLFSSSASFHAGCSRRRSKKEEKKKEDRWISKAISLELRILKESLRCRGNQQVEEDSFASVSPSVVPPSEKQRGRAVRSGSDALGREGSFVYFKFVSPWLFFFFFWPEVVHSYRNLLPVFVLFTVVHFWPLADILCTVAPPCHRFCTVVFLKK